MAKIDIDINARDRTKPAIASAKINLTELGSKVTSLGMRMTGAFTLPILALGQFLLKNEEVVLALEPVKTAFAQVGTDLATSLLPVIQDLAPALISFAGSLASIVSQFNLLTVEQKETILTVLGVIAALGPLVMIIGQVITAVGAMGTIWTAVSGILAPIISTVLPVLAGIFGAITLPVWLLIAAIGLLIFVIIRFGKDAWNTITNIAKIIDVFVLMAVWKIQELGTKIGVWLLEQFNAFKTGVQGIVAWIGEKISGAFDAVRTAITKVITWVKNLITEFKKVTIPAWLTPGSPTPFEMGLLGIGKAMSSLSNSKLPQFTAGLNLLPGEMPGVNGVMVPASTNGQAGTAINFTYAPMISLATQSEIENVLLPMVRKVMRSA